MAPKLKTGAAAFALSLLLAATAADPAATPVAADLQVQVSDVTDTRSQSSSSAGQAIDLRVRGADPAVAQAFRTTLQRASDVTGRTLLPEKGAPAEFTTLDAGTSPSLAAASDMACTGGSGRHDRADCPAGSAPMDHPMTLALLLALVGSLVLMTVIVKRLEKAS